MRGATAKELVVLALKKLGVVTRRTPAKPQDIQDGLDALWLLLESFNTQSSLIPFYTKFSFTMDTTQRVYTLGPGADLDMPIPLEILSAQFVDSGGTYRPISVVQGIQYFQNVNPSMGVVSARPTQVIWNQSVPIQSLEFNSVPAEEDTLILSVKLPWTVENCQACSSGSCAPGQTLSESDYSITISDDDQAYCNDECQLNITQQMRDWLDAKCEPCEAEDQYTQEFEYNGLKVTAIASLEARTEPNPVALTVDKDMEFPIGYLPLIMWCLAEALLPEYPQDNPVTVQEIKTQAAKMMRQIKNKNAQPSVVQYDPSLLANFCNSPGRY